MYRYLLPIAFILVGALLFTALHVLGNLIDKTYED